MDWGKAVYGIPRIRDDLLTQPAVVQWLRLCIVNVRGMGFNPDWGTTSSGHTASQEVFFKKEENKMWPIYKMECYQPWGRPDTRAPTEELKDIRLRERKARKERPPNTWSHVSENVQKQRPSGLRKKISGCQGLGRGSGSLKRMRQDFVGMIETFWN